jgi:molecular chaperone GrpE (heat shock protein)
VSAEGGGKDAGVDPPAKKVFAGVIRPEHQESQRWAEPLVARLASEMWRLRRRLERAEQAAADDQRLRPLRDSVTRLDDILAEFRVELIEHDGQPYDPGLQVEVLHAREGEGPTVIVETIRPTVLLGGRVLQQGQVVIGPSSIDTGEWGDAT